MTSPLPYTARIEDPDTGEVQHFKGPSADPDVFLSSLQVSGPDVREVVYDRAAGNGTIDPTEYTGAAGAALEIVLGPDLPLPPWEYYATYLTKWARPRRRPYLYVRRTGWEAEWRIPVRASGPWQPPTLIGAQHLDVQLLWRCPTGFWESADEQSTVIMPSVYNTTIGQVYPKTFPRTYGSGAAPGAGVATVGGTEEVWPIVDIYGACSDPILINNDTGLQIVFNGLTLASGEYVTIDMREQEIYANGDELNSYMTYVDWGQSEFFNFEPGDNNVAFVPVTPGNACQCNVRWRDKTMRG